MGDETNPRYPLGITGRLGDWRMTPAGDFVFDKKTPLGQEIMTIGTGRSFFLKGKSEGSFTAHLMPPVAEVVVTSYAMGVVDLNVMSVEPVGPRVDRVLPFYTGDGLLGLDEKYKEVLRQAGEDLDKTKEAISRGVCLRCQGPINREVDARQDGFAAPSTGHRQWVKYRCPNESCGYMFDLLEEV